MGNDVEIYFQPFLNGDRPDIILMNKNYGVIIIEVKDWSLPLYKVDENNKWYVKSISQKIKSPFQQVFSYKNNLFNLHINGLLERKLKNNDFYGLINVYVYFHGESKFTLNDLYNNPISAIEDKISSLNLSYRNAPKEDKERKYNKYENERVFNQNKKDKLNRDKTSVSITKDNLNKIKFPNNRRNNLFDISIYYEFKRYLQPPFHTLNDGKEIIYEKKQEKLSISHDVHEKIKGVAGAGKTVVLAKRAVNSHKRHGGVVLILTYNLTLKSYIHDKISEVREDFNWSNFYITNYHQLISQTLNHLNIEIETPDASNSLEYLDEQYYSNLSVFDSYENEIIKYKSIFIDETQDYKPEWIKIIRKYFLEDSSEMVLFGDEKQNIYERDIDKDKNTKVVQGFGTWNKLNKSIRHKKNSHILTLAKTFQQKFFSEKYDIDKYEENPVQREMIGGGINKISSYSNGNLNKVVSSIFRNIKENDIHPNDVTILCSKIRTIREIDYIVRTEFNEKTLTTFETKEMSDIEHFKKEIDNIRKVKKIGFNLNSGVLKLSTIHSFKGYESPTVFLIIDDNDHSEMVYVGITRAKFNIMIFLNDNSIYMDFFTLALEKEL